METRDIVILSMCLSLGVVSLIAVLIVAVVVCRKRRHKQVNRDATSVPHVELKTQADTRSRKRKKGSRRRLKYYKKPYTRRITAEYHYSPTAYEDISFYCEDFVSGEHEGLSWLSSEAGEPFEQLGLGDHSHTVVGNIRPKPQPVGKGLSLKPMRCVNKGGEPPEQLDLDGNYFVRAIVGPGIYNPNPPPPRPPEA